MLSLRRRAKAGPLDRLLDPEDAFWQRYREAVFPVILRFAIPIVLAGAKAGHRARMTPTTKAAPQLKPIQLPVGTHLTDAHLRRIMGDTIREFSSDLTETLFGTTYDAVKEAVARAASEGKPVSAVIRDLKPLFGPDRARTIAVTETTRLMGAGSQAIYRAQDVSYWQWLTVNDDLVCPICEDLDGTEFYQTEDFEPAHPRCRCFPAPVEESGLDVRAAQWTVALRYDDSQPRDDQGRWTEIGTTGEPSDKQRANAAAWAAEHGITAERVGANLSALYGSATPEQLQEGLHWYEHAHDIAVQNAATYGGTVETQAALLAALSPQVNWDVNVRGAEVINEALASDTFTLTEEDANARFSSMQATAMIHMQEGADAQREFDRLGRESEFLRSHIGTVPTSSVSSADLSRLIQIGQVLSASAAKGIDILRGASPDETLGGFKVRSFYNNIAAPTESKSVTIDSHMIRGMLNDPNADPKVLGSVFKNPARYDMMAGLVSDSAKAQGILPLQAQAVDWTVWRDAH